MYSAEDNGVSRKGLRMKVSESDYRYGTCLYCRSKKLSPVAVVRLCSNEYRNDNIKGVSRTGYLCSNCQRYIVMHKVKYTIDRAEMRRDANRLLAYLGGKDK